MILECSGWVLDVDPEATAILSREELDDHCTCDFCQNFYKTVRSIYPNLEAYLKQFGIELFAPEVLTPNPQGQFVHCSLSYLFFGSILSYGPQAVCVDSASICFREEDDACYMDFELILPWVMPMAIYEARLADGSVLSGYKDFGFPVKS